MNCINKCNLSLVQMAPTLGDMQRNASRISESINTIVRQRPDTNLVVFPELALTGYECADLFPQIARRPEASGEIGLIRETAREKGIFVLLGYAEKGGGERVHNSLLLIGSDGNIAGNHRKVHLPPAEKGVFTQGDDYCLCETPLGRVGLLNCWDAAFPEVSRLYALSEADFLVVAAAWEEPYDEPWVLSVRSRALDNGLAVAAVNRVGKDKTLSFFGRSLFSDAMGKVLQEAPAGKECVIHQSLDLDSYRKQRETFSSQVLELRSDTYKLERVITRKA
ncbi:MAG: carbon-nitrogen hydrolase family protein [Bacillota bacterium]